MSVSYLKHILIPYIRNEKPIVDKEKQVRGVVGGAIYSTQEV